MGPQNEGAKPCAILFPGSLAKVFVGRHAK